MRSGCASPSDLALASVYLKLDVEPIIRCLIMSGSLLGSHISRSQENDGDWKSITATRSSIERLTRL